mgnify:CR=1 FL=1
MSLAEQVKDTLKSEYSRGDTYKTIAARHRISIPYARGLILGTDRAGGISLAKLETMFPHATLDLRGASSSQVMQNCGNGNRQIMGPSSDSSSDLASYQLRLYRGLAGLDISDDAKAKVLALIQSAGEPR